MAQTMSSEWREQWLLFQDDEKFLFEDWIRPATIEDFRGKKVLECGCGGGQHTFFISQVAESVTAVDLNTTEIAKERNKERHNIRFIEGDLATIDLKEVFDVVVCIGVIHHTDNPDAAFNNIYRHCKDGGKVIIWTYSEEGNALVKYGVEPFRKIFLTHVPRPALVWLSRGITALMHPIVHTVYRLPFLSFLPYYTYFKNFRTLSFTRNVLNVFDKLNAPQTHFTSLSKCHEWFNASRFEQDQLSILPYAGVSYSLVGVKRGQSPDA